MESKSSALYEFISKMAEWFSRFASVNFLWFVVNIPVFIVSFTMIIHQNYLANLIILFFLIPVIFFPSTIAMVAVTRDWVLRNDENSIIKNYWRYLKENYKIGVKIGFILTAIWMIWGIDFRFFSQVHEIAGFFFILMAIFLIAWSVNSMSYVSHYEMSLRKILKNSFIFTFASPLALFFILLIIASVVYATDKFIIILPFFTGSIIAYFSFLIFYQQILKVEHQSEAE